MYAKKFQKDQKDESWIMVLIKMMKKTSKKNLLLMGKINK